MHVQVLASGSGGNTALVRAGETHILLDAGLTLPETERRLDRVRVSVRALDHIVLTHGHLDHARCAGRLAKKSGAQLHCAVAMMRNTSICKAPRLAALCIGDTVELANTNDGDPVQLLTVPVPHDADPTVALRLEAHGRVLALVTDMGKFDREVGRRLADPHVLILEFNHDEELLQAGPYPAALKRRVAGPRGHLSNTEACTLLREIAGPRLHTLVLAHLSATNNSPELASSLAHATLRNLGFEDVSVLIASQDEPGPNLEV